MNWKLLIAAGAIVLSGTIHAQTPDGQTPANEGICDGLIGGTPGLYGLCVAYCEAQDCDYDASQSMQCMMPNSRVLANYNKKKRSEDPGMPCLIDQPLGCRCFTIEEAETMLLNPNLWYCGTSDDGVWYSASINVNSNPGAPAIWLHTTYEYGNGQARCQFVRTDVEPNIIRQVEWHTAPDLLPCHEIVEAVIANNGMSEVCYRY